MVSLPFISIFIIHYQMKRLFLSFLLFAAMAILAPEFLDSQTSTPTTRPTTRPTTPRPTTRPTTSRPTTKPTNKPPTRNPTELKPGIYGDFGPKEYAPQETQQIIVGILIILLLVLMAFEISTPEILFLIALIIVILAEILYLKVLKLIKIHSIKFKKYEIYLLRASLRNNKITLQQ